VNLSLRLSSRDKKERMLRVRCENSPLDFNQPIRSFLMLNLEDQKPLILERFKVLFGVGVAAKLLLFKKDERGCLSPLLQSRVEFKRD